MYKCKTCGALMGFPELLSEIPEISIYGCYECGYKGSFDNFEETTEDYEISLIKKEQE